MIKIRSWYIVIFSITAGILAVLFAFLGISPFGDIALIGSDMGSQYIDFMSYLSNMFKSGVVNLDFSLNLSMGSSFLPLLMYYLSSPITVGALLIHSLFEGNYIIELVSGVTIIKMALSSVTMMYYLNKHFNYRKYNYAFAFAYALCAFNLIYSESLMWIDGVILLPVVLAFVDDIIGKKGYFKMIFIISLLMIANFYTGYMVIIFSGIYYLYQYLQVVSQFKWQSFLKQSAIYVGLVVTGCLLVSFLLLPTMISILQNRVQSNIALETTLINWESVKGITQFFVGNTSYENSTQIPLLYASTTCFLLCGLFFVSKYITVKNKVITAIVGLIIVSGLFFEPINRVWHLFQTTIGYPYRYTFCITFFIIIVAYQVFMTLKKDNNWLVIIGGLLLIGTMTISRLGYNEKFIALNIGLTALVIVTSLMNKKVLLVFIVFFEVSFNAYLAYQQSVDYYGSYNAYISHDTRIRNLLPDDLNGSFRMESTLVRDKRETLEFSNESMTFGYNGISSYASTYNQNIYEAFSNLGYPIWALSMMYQYPNPLIDSMIGMKYIVTDKEIPYYHLIKNDDGYLYENPYRLPMVFTSSRDLSVELSTKNPVLNQNKLFNLLFDENFYEKVDAKVVEQVNVYQFDDVSHFKNASGKDGYYIYQIDSAQKGYIFASFVNMRKETVISIQSESLSYDYLHANEFDSLFYIGDANNLINFKVNLVTDTIQFDSVDFYVLKTDKLEKLKTIDNNNIRRINNQLEVEMLMDGYLYLSIPQQKSVSVFVNNQKIETESWLQSMIKIPLIKGHHTVSFSISLPGECLGRVTSIVTLMGVCYGWFRKKKQYKCRIMI